LTIEHTVTHCATDAVAHEKSGLVGDAVLAVDLMGADALLGSTHNEYRCKPDS